MQLCALLLLATSATALLSRDDLFFDSSSSAKMSPDGTMVGFIAPDANMTRNVFMLRVADRQKRQVTFEENDVFNFVWTGVKDVIIFMQDNNGDENWMLFQKNISEKASVNESTVVYRKAGVAALILANNEKDNYVLIGTMEETSEFNNVYKYDIYSNELSLVFTNTRFTAQSIYTDNNMNIRLASAPQEDGSFVYYKVSPKANSSILTSEESQWEEYFRVKADDAATTGFVGFDASNENVYLKWGADTDLGSLILAPLEDFSQREVVYTPRQGELSLQSFLFHPTDRTLIAFAEYYHKPELVIYNETVAEDIQFLTERRPSDALVIVTVSTDFGTWLITYASSEKPNEIFLYRRHSKSIELLMNLNPKLEGIKLYKQTGFDFVARDGLRIQAYLSLPPNAPLKSAADVPKEFSDFAAKGMIAATPQKMVVLVHWGPKDRDFFGFSPMTAGLTDRGYAVLQVNFRGSTGFGKKLTNAAKGEWSRKMHTDLLDAVEFVVERGIAVRSAIAIMGISYGGYATLVGLTFTPDVFACGVDTVGPTNLVTQLQSFPPGWKAVRKEFVEAYGGDPDTEEGRKELIARSPFFIADRVKKPLMIMQGANDVRVKQHESEQFVAALKNHSIPVTYILYPDEGHGFRRTPNLLAQFGFVERFLHNCLGGEYQPFKSGQHNESAIVKTDGFSLDV